MAVSPVVTRNAQLSEAVRLLIVEDSEPYLYLIQKAFGSRERIRWVLTVARDGEQAIKLLFDEERKNAPLPDLILMDWKLPAISGSELLQRIKTHEKLRKIPVLVFSSSDSDRDIHDAYDIHANGYITKPDSVKVLGQIVDTIEQFWIGVAKLPKVVR